MLQSVKHIGIFCNPKSGKAETVAGSIVEILRSKGIAFSTFIRDWPDIFNEVTQAWIVGGDGTLNYFINRYPDVTVALSIFKGGTGNDFANFLYPDQNITQQIDVLLNGKSKAIDAATCNSKLFINGIGIGFDGAIVKDLLSKSNSKSKSSYWYAIFKNLLFYKEKKCLLVCDDKVYDSKKIMINILNGQSLGGGFKVAPRAALNDGRLDVNIVDSIAPLKRLYYVPVIKKGAHVGLPFVKYHQAKKIEVRSVHLLPAHLDGEYFSANHFIIECLPDKFSFIW